MDGCVLKCVFKIFIVCVIKWKMYLKFLKINIVSSFCFWFSFFTTADIRVCLYSVDDLGDLLQVSYTIQASNACCRWKTNSTKKKSTTHYGRGIFQIHQLWATGMSNILILIEFLQSNSNRSFKSELWILICHHSTKWFGSSQNATNVLWSCFWKRNKIYELRFPIIFNFF